MNFEIIVPTYKRYEQLVRMAGSLKNCLSLKNVERIKDIKCFVYFSCDDESTYLKTKESNAFDFIDHELVLMKESMTLVQKINTYFADHVNCDAVLLLTDDVTFEGSYIMDALLYYEQNFKDTDTVLALMSKNVYSKIKINFNNYSYVLIGKTFINRFPNKQVYCPFYSSHGIDDELRNFAVSINKWILFSNKNGIIVHDRSSYHSTTGVRFDGLGAKNARFIYPDRKKRGLIWGASFEK